jgi:hypothetical protein
MQLNETRELVVKLREGKDKEIRKMKERYEEERKRESEQWQLEFDKMKAEMTILQKRLGNEEQFSKELAIINNKLQNNTSTTIYKTEEVKRESIPSKVFYPTMLDEDDEDGDELMKRKQAWA